jgi:hypothetical protein
MMGEMIGQIELPQTEQELVGRIVFDMLYDLSWPSSFFCFLAHIAVYGRP